MVSGLEKLFSMGINIMSLAVRLGEDSSAAVVGLNFLLLLLGLSMVRWCSLNRSFKCRFIGERKRLGKRYYAATWLSGYTATQLRGHAATWLSGHAARRLRGYGATWLRSNID